MIEKKLDIAAEDGIAEAILYAPDSGKHPGLLFYTDIFRHPPRQPRHGQAHRGKGLCGADAQPLLSLRQAAFRRQFQNG